MPLISSLSFFQFSQASTKNVVVIKVREKGSYSIFTRVNIC